MRVLSVESYGAFVSRKGDRIVVKRKGEKLVEVPAGNVDLVRLASRGVSASMDFIELAVRYCIPVVVTSRGGKPLGVFLPFTYRGLVGVRKAQYAAQSSEAGVEVARGLVEAKIANQALLLSYAARTWKMPADVRARVMGAVGELRSWAARAASVEGPSCDAVRERLFSAEARAAQVYWSAFALLVPGELGFRERVKRGACDPVNCALNYGYAILATEAWLACLRAGLDPWSGFLHVDSQRRPALVFDLMEPFRPVVVDVSVLRLARAGGLSLGEDCMLDAGSRAAVAKAVYERLNAVVRVSGRRLTVRAAILLQARRVVARVTGRGRFKPVVWR